MNVEELRDALLQWIDDHDAECGNSDCREPANILAYLAHCAGLRSTKLNGFIGELVEYERTCRDCQHTRN